MYLHIILIVLISLSGCIQQLKLQLDRSGQDYKIGAESDEVSVKYDSNQIVNFMIELNKTYSNRENGTVYAFVCNYSKLKKVGWDKFKAYWKYLLGDKKALFDESLIGAYCRIENVSHFPSVEAIMNAPFLSPAEIKNNLAFQKVTIDRSGKVTTIEPPSDLKEIERLYKRYDRLVFFGLASGPSFSDFNELNPFCNNSLRYPVKFITGTETQYLIPALADMRAACYLDLGYIPIYVFHAKSGIPDVDNSGLLVARLSDFSGDHVGPVFLFTEASVSPSQLLDGLDRTGKNKYSGRIYAQIVSWKILCPKCIVGLTVPLDMSGDELRKLRDIIRSDPFLYENISVIGFGLDVDRLNKKTPQEMIFRTETIVKFARDLGKASAGLYMYIPQSWMVKKIRSDGFEYSDLDYLMENLYSIDSLGTSNLISLTGKGLIMLPTLPIIPESMSVLLGKNSPVSVLQSDLKTEVENAFSYTLSYCKNYFRVGQNPPIIFTDAGVDLKNMQLSSRSEYFRDEPSYREPIFQPRYTYTIRDRDDEIFKCVGCFLMLNSQEVKKFKTIFHLSKYNKQCDQPADVVRKIHLYSDMLDLDPPLLRSIIEELSNYDNCKVSFADTEQEQIERCGHRLKFSDIQQYLPSGCRISKTSDYVCGFGVMDVKVDIKTESVSPCKPSNAYLHKEIFDVDVNLCKGAMMLANASQQADLIMNRYGKYLLEDLDKNYLIYRMILTTLIYDQGQNYTEASAVFFTDLIDELKTVGLTGTKRIDNQKCWEYRYLPHFNNYCCVIGEDEDSTEMVNPYCVSLTNRPHLFWEFLMGMKNAPGMMVTSKPPYSISFQNAYLRAERTLNITSKYFDAYEKCKDCADEKWASNVDRKLRQICANLPDLPLCRQNN
ncbi:MAG: hypothetical protein NZ908_02140 [Candidatus Micrarchaeota archaeon]|nr:hypothetical protein [Candidatus Micrarchaeota archaeon]